MVLTLVNDNVRVTKEGKIDNKKVIRVKVYTLLKKSVIY